MNSIIISPFSSKHPESAIKPELKLWSNPKNYPWWNKVIILLKEKNIKVIQVGSGDEKKLNDVNEFFCDLNCKQLLDLLLSVNTFISVDNFFHHFAHYYNKKGVVIFGKSDPLLFGYPENVNLLKDRKYLRHDQYFMWTQTNYDENVFVSPQIVIDAVLKLIY